MEIRNTTEADFQRVMEIYESARRFMAEHGNPHQWGRNHWPPPSLVLADIQSGRSYVCVSDNRVVGVFYYDSGTDVEQSYRVIEGKWLGGSEYGVVHRLATDGSVSGTGAFCLHWAYGQCQHMRIDTHPDNVVMQNLLEKCGFQRRGIIHVAQDADPRYAYEK
ncbi:MAG: GNAT family N-acetyltransferase [Ndongobacter sp.]|nr:GNAT family N-acetyltransferase [Ndongobacter sp.]